MYYLIHAKKGNEMYTFISPQYIEMTEGEEYRLKTAKFSKILLEKYDVINKEDNCLQRTTEQVSKIDYTFANAPKESESYTYSKYGNLETVTDKAGNKKYYKYDVFGQLIRALAGK